jgi:hypothetical protein
MTEERCAKGRESTEPPLGRTSRAGRSEDTHRQARGSGRVRSVDDHSDEWNG